MDVDGLKTVAVLFESGQMMGFSCGAAPCRIYGEGRG